MQDAVPTFDDYAPLRARVLGDRPSRRGARVSLITVCRNAEATVGRTLSSVRRQDLPGLEHVVVDGASTDGTAAAIRDGLRPGDVFVSEPDRGISDAMNKGLALASGAVVQFVHADDWLSDGQVARALEALEATGADYVYGDLIFYKGGVPDFAYKGDPGYARSIARRMPALNHPTVLCRRDAFERVGLFDLRYRCAMDYEWFLRLHRAGGRGAYAPGVVGHMNHDGVSNTAFRRTMTEVRDIAVRHGRSRPLAAAEARFRILKMTLGRLCAGRARGLYDALRARLNPSYAALPSGTGGGDGRRD